MRNCIIFGGASLYNFNNNIGADDYVIAADAGLKHCERLDIKLDLIVGDFDSYGGVPEGENIIRLKPEKDDTDTLVCIKRGLELGCERFIIYGGTGGRFEHTLANLQSLNYIRRHGAHGFLVGERDITVAVCDESAYFGADCRGFISLFAMDSTITATERGLKYSLDEDAVTNCFPLGVSNEFTGRSACIAVKGMAAIVYDVKNGVEAVEFSDK